LPPDMTKEELEKILAPLPPHDYFKFHAADNSLAPAHTTRCYINFPNFEDILLFRDRFDNQIFEDKRGQEYLAYVELAPFQLIPRGKSREDHSANTIETDEEFKNFKEKYEAAEPENSNQGINVEEYLKEAAAKEEAKKATISTPLIDFIRNKRETKKKARDERRRDERRKRREDERKLKRQAEKKERLDRKKDLIDSKNTKGKNDHEKSEGNSKNDDSRSEKPDTKKGGRFAAREKRKKEYEEKRKQKLAGERAKRAEEKNSGGPSEKSEEKSRPPQKSDRLPKSDRPPRSDPPSKEPGSGPKNKRYSRRKDAKPDPPAN